MVTCDDLRLGGTLSGSGLSGGMSINSTALGVADWSTLFGTVGQSGSLVAIYGRPGAVIAGDRLPRERLLDLSINVHKRIAVGADCTPSEQALADNTDEFLRRISVRNGTFLEVDMPDATKRFIRVVSLDPGPMTQPSQFRQFTIPLVAPWGHWWEGGAESSQLVNGSTPVVVGGSQPVYDAKLTFSGAGTFTHPGLDWAIQALAGTFPLVVDLGARTVTQGGNSATNRIRRTPIPGDGRIWGWFRRGTNNVTSTVNVTVTWRDQWL